MSLNDFQCCNGGLVNDGCPSCPFAPRVPARREIEIESRHQLASREFDKLAKRALTEGARSALTMVEVALAQGLTPEAAIDIARRGTDLSGQP